MPSETRFIHSFYHTPSEMAKNIFLMVLRAGHLQAGPDYRVERRVCAGHDLLLCLRGRGCISVRGRVFPVAPGQLGWLDGHHPHAHWGERTDPWELLWARIDGHSLDQIVEALGIQRSPVFDLPDPNTPARTLRRILRLMRTHPPALEALVHAQATCLIAALFEARQSEHARSLEGGPELPANIRKAVEDLSLYYYRRWRIGDLAREAGLSVTQFFRCFRKATGSTPISFLRRERMSQAKRRLLESADSIKEIAEQVGYSDQFYFSRDFKRYTGTSPCHFRLREMGGGGLDG